MTMLLAKNRLVKLLFVINEYTPNNKNNVTKLERLMLIFILFVSLFNNLIDRKVNSLQKQ